MTKQELAAIEARFEDRDWTGAEVMALAAEVRRLWNILDAIPPWDRCPWCGADPPWMNGYGERGGGCGADCPNPTVAAV
jgi:hypothetical protein